MGVNAIHSKRDDLDPNYPAKKFELSANLSKYATKWPEMTQNGPNMTQNGPRMTQNDPKWPKNDPKWPTITPKWPKNEQELCEQISLSRAHSELRDWLTRPLLGSERRSSAPTLYATLYMSNIALSLLSGQYS